MKLARPASIVAVLVLLALGGLAHAIELGAVTIRNGSGSSIGRVDADGTLRNDSGSSIGRIERDGTIRNGSGSSVGRIDGYSPGLRHMVAAVLFFGGSVSVLKL
jgi:hypothetical protein